MPYTATEVFTPSTVARLTFVERQDINDRLVSALRTPGKQLVVYGRSGGGKTTLLENKLNQTYERHIKSQCIGGTTFSELLLDAFDQLEPFFLSESRAREAVETSREIGIATSKVLEIRALLGEVATKSQETTRQRGLPLQLTPKLLASLVGEASACWVIEDLHKNSVPERQAIAQTMKLFMDAADQYPYVRIIVIGAVGAAGDLLKLDPELWHRVSEIEVTLMNRKEILDIVHKGEELLNVHFAPTVKDLLVHFSNGLPAVCHQLCLNMCDQIGIIETITGDAPTLTEADFATALAKWLDEAGDSLRSAYDFAIRIKRTRTYDNCRLILHALAALDREGATHPQILKKIRQLVTAYPAGNLSTYLGELQQVDRGQVIVFDKNSGRYSFSSPMLHAYVRAQAREHHPTRRHREWRRTISSDWKSTFIKEVLSSGELNSIASVFKEVINQFESESKGN